MNVTQMEGQRERQSCVTFKCRALSVKRSNKSKKKEEEEEKGEIERLVKRRQVKIKEKSRAPCPPVVLQ